MTHKIAVFMNHYLYPNDPQTNSANCGCVSLSKIRKYLQEISDKAFIPSDSCLYAFYANFCSCDYTKVYLKHNSTADNCPEKTSVKELNINFSLKNKHTCCSLDCVNNICTGKCTDSFVTEIIGKKFFPEKYKNEQTKQR